MSLAGEDLSGRIKDLETALGALSTLVPAGGEELSVPGEADFRQSFRRLRTLVADLETAIGEREQVSSFAEFFTNVGDALVRAQRSLDVHTQAYLQEVGKRPHLLPAVFRIPTLSADIRFGLEKVADRRLNVIFYSKGSEAREMNQQSVHFEVVAAPPPPGALRENDGSIWRPAPILLPSDREPVLSALRLAVEDIKLPAQVRKELSDEVLEDFDAVLIFRGATASEFFLLLARSGDPKNLGVWYLVQEPPTVRAVYRYALAHAPDEQEGLRALQPLLSAVCTAQRELLKNQ